MWLFPKIFPILDYQMTGRDCPPDYRDFPDYQITTRIIPTRKKYTLPGLSEGFAHAADPSLAVCSEAATAPSTIWYRVCTKHGTRSGNLSSSRFGTTSGTRSILFRVPDDVRDLISGLVPDRRPDLVQDLRQDLSDRSGTRFYEIWYD